MIENINMAPTPLPQMSAQLRTAAWIPTFRRRSARVTGGGEQVIVQFEQGERLLGRPVVRHDGWQAAAPPARGIATEAADPAVFLFVAGLRVLCCRARASLHSCASLSQYDSPLDRDHLGAMNEAIDQGADASRVKHFRPLRERFTCRYHGRTCLIPTAIAVSV